ncbi:MAG: BMP family ABC transporter substrate-binding protein [Coriobacteriia bacterium]|nr:BMP family ABC transporter substrate-binding protein [Coriobacteriia bacterium]
MRSRFLKVLALLLAFALLAALAVGCNGDEEAEEEKPTSDVKAAMVTDVGGLGDKSFNDLSYEGLKKAEEDFGIEIKVLESKEITDYEQNIDLLVQEGYSPVFAVGFLMTDTVVKLAPTYPDTYFGGIDEFFDPTILNARGLNFNEHEASYLAGVLAAHVTTDKTVSDMVNDDKVVGFVGGMDVPLIKKFEAGFKAGVQSVDPSIKVFSLYAGNFTDQAKGKELGLSLIDQKADVIFAAAGAVGLGTIQACQEQGALFIGVDADQYVTVPDSGDVMLSSVVKRVDTAVYETIKSVVEGDFQGGENVFFGLKEGGMALAPYHDFENAVPQEIKDAVEEANQAIIDGTITVPDK